MNNNTTISESIQNSPHNLVPESQKELTEPHLGAIVALKSHPFFQSTQQITIFGEPQHIPPLMVIVEALKESENRFEPDSGIELAQKGKFQYKCMWFCNKSFQFESVWIHGRLLKLIKVEGNKISNKAFGREVEFLTSELELGKIKSSISDFSDSKITKKTTPLLSFASPVMHIVGTAKTEIKETLLDTFGKQKRWIPELLVKCKYFNTQADKYSEALIPIEALSKIDTVQEKVIKEIEGLIKESKFIKLQNIDIETGEVLPSSKDLVIYKILDIEFSAGRYYVTAFNYAKQNKEIIPVVGNKQFIEFEHKKLPLPKYERNPDAPLKISFVNSKNIATNLKVVQEKPHLIIITYKDRNDRITTRAVRNGQLLTFPTPTKEDPHKVIEYFIGECQLRNAERFFRVDGIISFEIYY